MNNTDYAQEVVPFNREALVIDDAELTRRAFRAGSLVDDSYPTQVLTGGASGSFDQLSDFVSLDDDSTPP